MRFPIWLTIVAALVGLALVYVLGTIVIKPNAPLIMRASFDDERITPNADGDSDITTFRYELSRSAIISLIFTREDGREFIFRQNQSRSPRDYSVLFSGVVDGYINADETFSDDVVIERRLMPDGVYTWRLTAANDGEQEEANGTLIIEDADSPLPLISTFTVGSREFTPNQDGISDRVVINVYLEKEANLNAFLVTEDGDRFPIAQREEWSRDGEAGRYTFDYEGGVDLGQDPPPDGDYAIVVIAQDDEGQRVRRESRLAIRMGGKPRAEIAPQAIDADVLFMPIAYDDRYYGDLDSTGALLALPQYPEAVRASVVTVPLGDMLVFRLTINNYSDVPLRTTSPMPGTVYEQNQNAASLGALEEPGAWRVGIQCATSIASFPYRWAIGSDDDLVTIVDEDTGREFQYLPPQTQAVVWGAIRMTDLNEAANPQTCWAGLIHEQVGIGVENAFVGARDIQLATPYGADED
ncbi:MAG: hypothetical protein Q9P01_04660 [Anaerolineae bacterium]|nr:hypothetical protein [Anaerolineae bacterium]MDQ7034133.1 hypothetical protein [Anaerolineae bacterium]